jgi:hypothetical protein
LHKVESIVVILCKSNYPTLTHARSCVFAAWKLQITIFFASTTVWKDFAMVSAMRIVALLGLSALVKAHFNSSTTTISTTSLDCQADNCLRQFRQSTEVTTFCATFTTDVITEETELPSFVSMCSENFWKISSACSCVVPPQPTTCQPSTITVTFTPPIQTFTTTQKYVTHHAYLTVADCLYSFTTTILYV